MLERILKIIFSASIVLICTQSIAVESFNQLPPEVQREIELEKYKVRLKDIISFEGIRDNILMGYGLVVGLNASGDNLKNATFTQKELENFLERLGVNSTGANIKTKNTAAVTVTATLPAFARVGSKINISIATLGDAKSLLGGILLATPLLGADGEVYAVAQGNVIIGPMDKDRKDIVYTTGYINSGAIIEKETEFELNSMSTINLGLHEPDITTATNIEKSINLVLGNYAKAIDPATVVLTVPKEYRENVLSLLQKIEKITVLVETPAKIIIDIKSGMVVMNSNVKIGSVAIAKGNLALSIGPHKDDSLVKVSILENNVTVKDLVEGLNALGLEPREFVEILENMKSLGALHADIITR